MENYSVDLTPVHSLRSGFHFSLGVRESFDDLRLQFRVSGLNTILDGEASLDAEEPLSLLKHAQLCSQDRVVLVWCSPCEELTVLFRWVCSEDLIAATLRWTPCSVCDRILYEVEHILIDRQKLHSVFTSFFTSSEPIRYKKSSPDK